MVSSISILGSTGSIGRQTVEAAASLGIEVRALTADKNTKLIEEQARRLKPKFVAMYDEAAARQLRTALADTDIVVGSGMHGLIEAATIRQVQAVVTAVSGSVGLRPTLAAIERGRRIALANKETLVCAGSIVMAEAKKFGAEIIPVDSEHSAIFQSLAGGRRSELRRVLLTGSGGPFRGKTLGDMAGVTAAQAVKHPNWNMGAKISVDSATLMNKGLEFIEAMHLFAVSPEDIKVLIHPQSVVHSMVEFRDGAVIAQLGIPDMALPIRYALTYPERVGSDIPAPDFFETRALTFEEPDLENFPCLALAMSAARTGGTAPAILSAANEEAVRLFLGGNIGYNDIYTCVADALESIDIVKEPDMQAVADADAAAREHVIGKR